MEASSGESTEDRGRDLSRIIGLSDGVFGFALTLLATGIGIPAFARDIADAQLTQEVLALLPQFLIYAATFCFIIVKWMAHRHIFAVIEGYDTRVIWLNNLFLLMIAFMPVPSKILVEYPSRVAPVVFFAAAYAITTLAQEVLWAYVSHDRRLIKPHIDADYIRSSNLSNVGLIAALFLSIGVAIFISPTAAVVTWILAAVGSNLAEQKLRRSQ